MTSDRGAPEDAAADIANAKAAGAASYFATKRALDLVLGTMGLIAAMPILLTVWVVMRASGDRGPFLYRAARVGVGGRPITVLKIRTMQPGAGGPGLTARDDPRVTRVGRRLRRYRLDELPQLWNVLRGDMTLVGPRPEDPAYVDFSDPLHRRVFSARPGITGLAQLAFVDETEGREGPDAEREYRETILPAKLKLDGDYLDRQSLRLDLAILLRTAAAIVGRGDTARGG